MPDFVSGVKSNTYKKKNRYIGVTKIKQVGEAAKINLTAEEVSRLEKLGDGMGIHTLREWKGDVEFDSKRSNRWLSGRSREKCRV